MNIHILKTRVPTLMKIAIPLVGILLYNKYYKIFRSVSKVNLKIIFSLHIINLAHVRSSGEVNRSSHLNAIEF